MKTVMLVISLSLGLISCNDKETVTKLEDATAITDSIEKKCSNGCASSEIKTTRKQQVTQKSLATKEKSVLTAKLLLIEDYLLDSRVTKIHKRYKSRSTKARLIPRGTVEEKNTVIFMLSENSREYKVYTKNTILNGSRTDITDWQMEAFLYEIERGENGEIIDAVRTLIDTQILTEEQMKDALSRDKESYSEPRQ